MTYEVEMKFPVADVTALEAKLAELGAAETEARHQHDQYYQHPARDFAKTDEAFRIRQEDDTFCLTYKGPKLDATTKTRQEIEVPLTDSPAAAADLDRMLASLGFQQALMVEKHRRRFVLHWQGRKVEAMIDEVTHLGTFVELEIVTDAAGLDAARELILSLAEHCQLGETERRSYLELLLEHGAGL